MEKSITQLLEDILSAVYGEDVRKSIHDAILKSYEDATKEGNANMEVSQARGIYTSLSERLAADLSNTIEKIQSNTSQITDLRALISDLSSGSPLAANSVNSMIDRSRVYVNTSDGYLYYHNGTSWVKGWEYQSAEDSASVDGLLALMKQVDNLYNSDNEVSGYIGNDGSLIGTSNIYTERTSKDYYPCTSNEIITIIMESNTKDFSDMWSAISTYNSNKEFLTRYSGRVVGKSKNITFKGKNYAVWQYKVNDTDAAYMRISYRSFNDNVKLAFIYGDIYDSATDIFKNYNLGEKAIEEKLTNLSYFSNGGIDLEFSISNNDTRLISKRMYLPLGTSISFNNKNISIGVWEYDTLGKWSNYTDSGWLDVNTIYKTHLTNYIRLFIKKNDGSLFTKDEIENIQKAITIKINNWDRDLHYKIDNPVNMKNINFNYGGIDINGSLYGNVLTRVRTNPIKVTKGTIIRPKIDFFLDYTMGMHEYDENGEQIVGYDWQTIPYIVQNDCYLRICCKSVNGNNVDLTQEDIEKIEENMQISLLLSEDVLEKVDTPIDYSKVNANIKAINHRGYNSIAPENTLSAFRLSKQMGFDKVECDVSFTSDGVPVLLHDNTIDRTSNGTGNINELPYDYVRTLDFGSWKSANYAGEKIPSFEEFILLCKNIGLHPYIELKPSAAYSEAQIQSLVDIVRKYKMEKNCTWISFSYTFLNYVKNYDNEARLGGLKYDLTALLNLKTNDNEVFADLSLEQSTEQNISALITNDIPLEVWTINTSSVINSLNSYVSGVTSDLLIAGYVRYRNAIDENIYLD